MRRVSINNKKKRWYKGVTTKLLFVIILALALSLASITLAVLPALSYTHQAKPQKEQHTFETNVFDQWEYDKQTTTPSSSFMYVDSNQLAISPLFASYYRLNDGANMLEQPLTIAFPFDGGWLQFFQSGALFLPASLQTPGIQNTNAVLANMIANTPKDDTTGVVHLTFLQELITIGSKTPVGGEGSTLTYVGLRNSTLLNSMVPEQSSSIPRAINTDSRMSLEQRTFVKSGVRSGKVVGHYIEAPFWNYINQNNPDDWQQQIGVPLTEAVPFTIVQSGVVHHMLIQVFSSTALLYDQDASVVPDPSSVSRLNTGVDFLRTFGLPIDVLSKGQSIWGQSDTVLLDAPGTGHPLAHVGQGFPLTALGNTMWVGGVLWYAVRWKTVKGTYSGWVASSDTALTAPSNDISHASFDVLSPDLQTYFENNPNVGAVLYDVTHQTYYTYNSSTQFIVASSMKVPIMLTFLNMIEQQGREPTSDEMSLLTTMIENSNNDSASALFSEVGQSSGISSYMQKIGIVGLNPDDGAWGYSTMTPQTMVDMLTLLSQGRILTAEHRSLALNLMENIEPDQQAGIGDTAPSGATVAMKDGWVPGPDNLWAMNTSGIVTEGNETYILSVYTQEQPSLDSGQAITRYVCSTVASLLIS